MKKCLIIYYSYHHGNTEKIAKAMAEASGADICDIDNISTVNTEEYELIGLGSGIAYGKHYSRLLDAVAGLDLIGKKVFVFSTSGMVKKQYNTELINLVNKAEAPVLGSFSCKGLNTYGPFKLIGGISKGHPDDEDIAEAKKFIQKIVASE